MTLAERLSEYVRAAFSGIYIRSHEHDDAIATLIEVAREAAEAPEDVRGEKGGEEEDGPQKECAAESGRLTDDVERLQLAELIGSEQRDGGVTGEAVAEWFEGARAGDFVGRDADARQGADIGEGAGDVVEFARNEIARGGVGEKRSERWEEIFAGVEGV